MNPGEIDNMLCFYLKSLVFFPFIRTRIYVHHKYMIIFVYSISYNLRRILLNFDFCLFFRKLYTGFDVKL